MTPGSCEGATPEVARKSHSPGGPTRSLPESHVEWRRGDLADRIGNHLHAEAIYERQVGDTRQIIERVRVSATNAYERASYRLVEERKGKCRIVGLHDLLREARDQADRRVATDHSTTEGARTNLDGSSADTLDRR